MKRFIVVFFVLLLPSFALCDSKEMYIEGVTLRIGMTKDEARAALLKSNLDVKPMGDSGGYSIGSATGPPYEHYGSFSFDKNDRINWLSRSWGAFGGAQAVSLGKSLYNCLSKHEGKGFILTTGQGSQPGLAITSIRLSSADGTEILLILSDRVSSQYENSVGVQEILNAK
jgi:hypothetical protein